MDKNYPIVVARNDRQSKITQRLDKLSHILETDAKIKRLYIMCIISLLTAIPFTLLSGVSQKANAIYSHTVITKQVPVVSSVLQVVPQIKYKYRWHKAKIRWFEKKTKKVKAAVNIQAFIPPMDRLPPGWTNRANKMACNPGKSVCVAF